MTLPPRRENADSVSRKRAVQAGSPVRKRLVPMPMTGSLTPVDGTAFVSRSRAACADTESGTIAALRAKMHVDEWYMDANARHEPINYGHSYGL